MKPQIQHLNVGTVVSTDLQLYNNTFQTIWIIKLYEAWIILINNVTIGIKQCQNQYPSTEELDVKSYPFNSFDFSNKSMVMWI